MNFAAQYSSESGVAKLYEISGLLELLPFEHILRTRKLQMELVPFTTSVRGPRQVSSYACPAGHAVLEIEHRMLGRLHELFIDGFDLLSNFFSVGNNPIAVLQTNVYEPGISNIDTMLFQPELDQ